MTKTSKSDSIYLSDFDVYEPKSVYPPAYPASSQTVNPACHPARQQPRLGLSGWNPITSFTWTVWNALAIHAYVLMTNHVHLFATPSRDASLPKTLQSVGRRYVRYFNFTCRRNGTL